jgi:hypothetical protein
MVLKIDVEGEELRVLEGGATTLEEFKPVVIIEVHFRNETEAIINEMKRHDYTIKEQFHDSSNPKGVGYVVATHKES